MWNVDCAWVTAFIFDSRTDDEVFETENVSTCGRLEPPTFRHTLWGHWWRRLQPTSSIITDTKSVDSNRDDFARYKWIFRFVFLYRYSSKPAWGFTKRQVLMSCIKLDITIWKSARMTSAQANDDDWADVNHADFHTVISRYLRNISTYLFITAERTIIMQNCRLIQTWFPIKIDEVWFDRFCVRNDWWRRLQPTSSVSPVWLHKECCNHLWYIQC